MKKYNLTIVVFLFSQFLFHAQKLKSPDGKLEMTFTITDGVPFYNLKYKGDLVIEDSKLGLRIFDDTYVHFASEQEKATDDNWDLNRGFIKLSEKRDNKNEEWQPVLGEKKMYINHYNELSVTLHQSSSDRNMMIRFRLFNDGLGFRYEFPYQKNFEHFRIKEEDTEFDFPSDMKAWWIVADYDSQEYQPQTTLISEIPGRWDKAYDKHSSQTLVKNAVQSPLLLKKEGKNTLYVNVAEAAVLNYPASHLEVDAEQYKFKTHLTPNKLGIKAYLQTPSVTPWRTIIVSDKAAQILDSKLLFNLNEPTKYKDTSYIHPTKYMGVWWEMIIGKSKWAYSTNTSVNLNQTDFSKLSPNGKHGANNEKVKEYIDFASENGFNGLLIEGWNIGWEDWMGHDKEFVFDFITIAS